MIGIEKLIKTLTLKNKTISLMESCTGGGFANAITNVTGASNVIKYSAITYSDEYKIKMGVDKEVIEKYGVYSEQVARNMAKTIADFSHSDYGIGITGRIEAMAYISIYITQKGEYLNCYIKLNDSKRQENKDKIISLVVDKLLEII